MKIIQRYYLKEFFKLFGIICIGLSLILSLIELINRIDDFMPHKPKAGDLLLYFILNMPHYLLYLMPMAGLISGLFVFGQAGRRREIVIAKASGYSVKALLMPFVYSGILLSIAGFLIGELIAADSNRMAYRLRNVLSKKENVLTVKEGTTWLKSKDSIIKVDIYLPDKGIIKGISIVKTEDDAITERIEADTGEWKPALEASGESKSGVWYLKGVTAYKIKEGTVKKFRELPFDAIDSPEIFKEGRQESDVLRDTMNVRGLIKYTNRLREAGFKNINFLVDIHSKISYPAINLIMLVLGISLSVRGELMGGLITAAIGIAISMLYLFGFSMSLSMGYAGILSPIAAAWLMPVVFGGGAWSLFRNVPE